MTIPGGFIAGDTLGAADMNLLPAGKMGFVQVTANQTTIDAIADLTSLTLTWTAVSSRRYQITGYCNMRVDSNPASNTIATVYITDSSNTVKQEGYAGLVPSGTTDANNQIYQTVMVSVTETGLSGSTTRKLRASSSPAGGSTGGNIALIASSTAPAWFVVEDIGPA